MNYYFKFKDSIINNINMSIANGFEFLTSPLQKKYHIGKYDKFGFTFKENLFFYESNITSFYYEFLIVHKNNIIIMEESNIAIDMDVFLCNIKLDVSKLYEFKTYDFC